MSPIGAIIMSILLITGIILAGGNYEKIGFSRNAWIGVNIAIFAVLVIYEAIHHVRKRKETDHQEDPDRKVEQHFYGKFGRFNNRFFRSE